jgi:hypothetical protein
MDMELVFKDDGRTSVIVPNFRNLLIDLDRGTMIIAYGDFGIESVALDSVACFHPF